MQIAVKTFSMGQQRAAECSVDMLDAQIKAKQLELMGSKTVGIICNKNTWNRKVRKDMVLQNSVTELITSHTGANQKNFENKSMQERSIKLPALLQT